MAVIRGLGPGESENNSPAQEDNVTFVPEISDVITRGIFATGPTAIRVEPGEFFSPKEHKARDGSTTNRDFTVLGGSAANSPFSDDDRPWPIGRRESLGLALAAAGVVLLAMSGCSAPSAPARVAGESIDVAEEVGGTVSAFEGGEMAPPDENRPPNVGRSAVGRDLKGSRPFMNTIDPNTLPDRLLWLDANRGVSVGPVASWDGTSQTRLQGPTGSGLQTGNVDFGFACWVRVDALPGVADLNNASTHIAGKWASGTNASREWLLCLNSPTGADQFCFVARGATTSSTSIGPRTSFPGGVEVGRWYFVIVWHDRTAKTLNMSVDGAMIGSTPYDGTPASGALAFTLGASHGMTGYPPISMGRATFFKSPSGGIGPRIGEIIESLYRGGEGADMLDLPAGQPERWGMVAFWPLDERNGTRRDEYGGLPDLENPTGINSALGPFHYGPRHNRRLSRWVDQVNGRVFRGDGVSCFLTPPRITTTGRSNRAFHDDVVLSGRTRWSATIVGSGYLNLGSGLYGEVGNPAGTGDDDYLDIRFDHDGVPELAIKAPGGPEVVARASDALAGRREVVATSTEVVTTTNDTIPRIRCRLRVGEGHPFAATDLVRVKGLGPPFDGTYPLTHATEDEVHYVVDNPQAAPATAGARRFAGGSLATNPSLDSRVPNTLDRRFPAPRSETSWTVAGWVRKTDASMDSLAGGSGVFVAQDCTDIRTLASRPQILHGGDGSPGTYRFSPAPDGPTGAFGPAPLNTWVHLAAVRSGNQITLYYNGAKGPTIDVSSDPGLGSVFTGLGFGTHSGVMSGLPCLLDNWGVWFGRALTDGEVAALRGTGPSTGLAFEDLSGSLEGLKDNLAAWYNFDEVSGTARDSSPNGHHLAERGVVPSAQGIGSGIPFSSAITGGLVVGSGLMQIAGEISTDPGPGLEHHRFVLTVRRDAGTISFFRNGEPIGSDTIPAGLTGPTSGGSRVLAISDRLGTLRGSVEHVFMTGRALTDEEVFGLGARFSIRTNRISGVGPLAVQFDATRVAGVDRMALQDYQYLWSFTRSEDGSLHDDSRSPESGHSYARSTGFFVSQVFEQEGSYDAHLAVVTPSFDRQGQPQESRCLFAGKVATITVDPWPENTTTYYVSSTHPNRNDNGPGTSPDAPLATIIQAARRISRPFTRILLRRGDVSPISTRIWLKDDVGPLLIGSYGDPEAPNPVLTPASDPSNDWFRLETCNDIRIVGLELRDTGARTGVAMVGHNKNVLIRDCNFEKVKQFCGQNTAARATVVDRTRMNAVGGYTIFSDGAVEMSLTRCVIAGSSTAHFFRYQQSRRTQFSHCYRENNYPATPTTWITLRHETQFFVVTDCFGTLMHTTVEPGNLHYMGVHWGLFERNRFREMSVEGSKVTVRQNEVSIPGQTSILMRDVARNIRGGVSSGGRVYDNQRTPDSFVKHSGPISSFLVEERNRVFGSGTARAPAIGRAEGGVRSAILHASDGGMGGSSGWSLRWMRRPAGGETPFEPITGQRGLALFDYPLEPGTYEYRLDLVSKPDVETIGEHVVTVVVPAEVSAPTGPVYRIDGPPSGLAGELSEPFSVSLLGEEPPPSGTITITLNSDGPGQFIPAEVVLSSDQDSAEFRYLPASAPEGVGAWSIGTTNDREFPEPDPSLFVVTVPIGEPPEEPPPVGPSPIRFSVTIDVVISALDGKTCLSAPPATVELRKVSGPLPGNSVQGLAVPPLSTSAAPGSFQGLAPAPRRR